MDLTNKETFNKLLLGLLIATIFIIGFNSLRLSNVNALTQGTNTINGAVVAASSAAPVSDSKILPKGVPAIYGSELGVSFDDVSPYDQAKADQTISKLGALDKKITLNEAQKQRYINILYNMENGISCEYCCGARAIIFPDGQPACGCAHSYAMRGVTKYLLTKHAEEYTDAEILEEAGKWKTLFFPGAMELKAQVLASQGIEFNYINLASNKYRDIEQSTAASAAGSGNAAAGAMVGGC